MGLDQYLTIRHKSTDAAIQQYNEYWNMTDEQREGLTEPVFPDVTELAYWRKANVPFLINQIILINEITY